MHGLRVIRDYREADGNDGYSFLEVDDLYRIDMTYGGDADVALAAQIIVTIRPLED